jgi:hypothetical protein
MRDPLRAMAASTLVCEALVVFFAGLVAMRLSHLSMGQALGLTGAVAVACLLAVGLLRSPLGYGVGSVLQVVVIGLGVWVPDMFGIGLLFAALWIGSLWYGAKVVRERRIVAAALADRSPEPDHAEPEGRGGS